ncbi:MAG: gliding motility-associated-like protein [Nonlabens sp.]|jgi:gliding motility-associated-like protein
MTKSIYKFGASLLFCFLSFFSYGQQDCLEILWENHFGGSGQDWARDIRQTDDGGYIVIGYSRSDDIDIDNNLGNWDYWVLKLNEDGTLDWKRNYGGSNIDQATAVWPTSDGGYVVAGASESNDGDLTGNNGGEDVWILKLNNLGDIEWQRNYGGTESDRAESIEQTADGGYIVAGYSESVDGDVSGNYGNFDYWVLKLDTNGNLSWDKNYGGSGADYGYAITQTQDGGYIFAGSSFSDNIDVTDNNGLYDYWVVRTDAAGNILWERNYGGEGEERAWHIAAASDGGFIIGGYTFSIGGDVGSNNGGTDYWIVKVDADGELEWENTYGGNQTESAFGLQQALDGGYILAGYAVSSGSGDVANNYGSEDFWLVKLDNTGNLEWEKNFGGTDRDRAYALRQSADGGYIMVGYSESSDGDVSGNYGERDYWVVKLNPIENTLDLGNDTTLCVGETLLLDATQPNAEYLWSTGSTDATILLEDAGTYSVEVFREGCVFKDTLTMLFPLSENVDLGEDVVLCIGDSLVLAPDFPGATFSWPDGSVGPTFTVTEAGAYNVVATLGACSFEDEIMIEYFGPQLNLGDDITVCGEGAFPLTANLPGATFQWSNGSSSDNIAVDSSGIYWVEATLNDCQVSDTIAIIYKEIEPINLGDNTIICEDKNQQCLLNVSRERGIYRWQDGSTDSTFLVTEAGAYSVTVYVDFCTFRDTIEFTDCNTCMHIPNAFTANFDGLNDEFMPLSNCELLTYNLQVFNRYGAKVFESEDISRGWDGRVDGRQSGLGVYVYRIGYSYDNKGEVVGFEKVGKVTLVR